MSRLPTLIIAVAIAALASSIQAATWPSQIDRTELDSATSEVEARSYFYSQEDFLSPQTGFSLVRVYDYYNPVTSDESQPIRHGWTFYHYKHQSLEALTVTDATEPDIRLSGQPPGDYILIANGLFAFHRQGQNWVNLNANAQDITLTFAPGHSTGDGRWTLNARSGAVFVFNEQGQQLEYARNDNYYSYYYNNQGLLRAIESAAGGRLQYHYNAQGYLAGFTNPGNETTRYEYDGQGRLVAVVYPDDTPLDNSDNPTEHYQYGSTKAPQLLTAIVSPRNQLIMEGQYNSATGGLMYRQVKQYPSARPVNTENNRVVHYWSNGLEMVSDSQQTRLENAGHTITDLQAIEATLAEAREQGHYVTRITSNRTQTTCTDCVVYSDTRFGVDWTHLSIEERRANGVTVQRIFLPGVPRIIMPRPLISERQTRHGQLVVERIWKNEISNNLLLSEETSGRLTTYHYDENGRRTSQIVADTTKPDAKPRITSYQYQGGQLTLLDGPRTDVNDTTAFEYDGEGNLIKVTNGLNQSTRYEYDNNNHRIATIDPNGLRTEVTYGVGDRILSRTLAAGSDDATTTSYQYDVDGNLTKITLPTGQMIARQYDSLGRVTQISDADGNRIDYQYDANGNLIEGAVYDHQQQSLVQVAQQAFDDFGRIVTRGNGDVAYQYQGGSEAPSAITTGNGDNTQLEYDKYNRLSKSIDAMGGETRYQYDEAGNITQVTDARGVTTGFEYNGFGERTAEHSPSKGTLTYKYDEAGNVTKETRQNGIIIKRKFDELNRPTQVVFKQKDQEKKRLNYIYDDCDNGIGKLCKVSGVGSTTRYDYDLRGNFSKVKTKLHDEATANVTKYEYNQHNQLTKLIYPSGLKVRYHYNSSGAVKKITAKQGDKKYTVADNIQYRPMQNGLSQITFGNGLTTQLDYNQQGQLTRIATGDVQDLNYQYDDNGNITQIDRPLRTDWLQQFEYDAMNRLVSESRELQELGYEYDSVGNRLVRTKQTEAEDGAVTTKTKAYHYAEASNRLDKINNQELIYDPNGNLIEDKDGKRRFEYDVTNRLTNYFKNGEHKASYTYNAFGQRIKKTIRRARKNDDDHKSITFTYLPEGWLVSEDGRDENNAKGWTRDYIWLSGKPIAQIKSMFKASGDIKNQTISYIHTDHLNTPRIATDNNQTVTWRWDSDAFGGQRADQDPDNDGKKVKISLRFPGQYYDSESKLYYNHFRDYDYRSGRYIQSDPTGILSNHDYLYSTFGKQSAVRGVVHISEKELNHSYAYVKQNPLRFIDPTGLRNPSPAEIVRPCINKSSAEACIGCCTSTYRFNAGFASICNAECHLKQANGGFDSGGGSGGSTGCI
ncbi:RHS repeat-associated core domain-containing protein [Porticoccus sp. W117]|uniref:RHS repeat-associated core domain-containing protein n=1 Tax=Porticoccus sp. W117 TaxID=3054777 RepID=UPI00259ACF7A|nr:RHS repeat-associated core domain-containing protein [Porticoccus sp. W117]MDM3870355.1 RHS repeat-associated core domain-containing protein [Porticoccus sp. W117]